MTFTTETILECGCKVQLKVEATSMGGQVMITDIIENKGNIIKQCALHNGD